MGAISQIKFILNDLIGQGLLIALEGLGKLVGKTRKGIRKQVNLQNLFFF